MPRNISIPERQYDAGQSYEAAIDGLPPQSEGFEATFTRVTWPAGDLADLLVEIATDGVNFNPWIQVRISGDGVEPTWVITALWPGISDGGGGRSKLRHTDVRVTLAPIQTFRSAIEITDL